VELKKNVGTAVICKNQVLLGKRIETHKGAPVNFGGYWSIFAGVVEDKEAPYFAAIRELYEETQLQPKDPIRYFRSFLHDDYEFLFYIVHVDNIFTPKLCFEHTESKWFDIESLSDFPHKIDKKIVDCILDYYESIN
jgi:8-oxo-dGTP pyrophosphatase MutT (NUDIX family)